MKLLCALLLLPLAAVAQTHRAWYGPDLATEAQLEFSLPRDDYAFLSLSGRRYTDDNTNPHRQLGFDQRLVSAGYEHFWTAHWSWGATARYGHSYFNFYPSAAVLVPGVLLRHRAALGSVTFGQRLELQYALTTPLDLQENRRTSLRLRLDIEKYIPLTADVNGVALRPRLSFEPVAFVRLQKGEYEMDKRTIDFTALRAELGFRVTPQLDFTPWFAIQTQYLVTLSQTNGMGQQTAGGKVNGRTPVLGLDVRYTLPGQRHNADRIQLPIQH